MWGFRAWLGEVYRSDARPGDFLKQYANCFSCVEGNTTFYQIPSAEIVARWRDETPESFRFCFKLPRAITHDAGLVGTAGATREFLTRMAPLGARLGPFMIQLPPSFGSSQLMVLERFLSELPAEFSYAVELRNRALFQHPRLADSARQLLSEARCNWVHLDTRSLRSGPQDHPAIRGARHPKPDLPIEPSVTADEPIVRFIAHPEAAYNEAGLEAWAQVLADWARHGARPYFFVHCPDDTYAPGIARCAHSAFSKRIPMRDWGVWPGESEPRQLTLW